MLNGGKTMLVSIGKKGKYVGVVGFHPNEAKPLRFHLVTLNRRFDGRGAPMKALIQDEYRADPEGCRRRRKLRPATTRQRSTRRNLRRRRDVQGLPPQHLRQVEEQDQARQGVRIAAARPQAEHDLRRRMHHLPHDRL